MSRSKEVDTVRHVMNLTTILVAVGFVVIGVVLLVLSSRTYAPADIWAPSLLGQIGGLLVATGLITVAWDLFGKRAFAAEVISKTQLRSDLVNSGLERVTDRYLQDVEWEQLFDSSVQLDIVVAYASTWRNTHRSRLERLVMRKNGRLRVFLPDPNDAETMSVLSKRFKMTPAALQDKVTEAIDDFGELAKHGDVKVYVRAGDAVFSCYQFDHRSVLTLYSHAQERRGSVPTFLVGNGVLRDFVGSDIDAIKKQSTPV